MRWQGTGGWATGTPYGRLYDPKAVETIRGEVVSGDRIIPRKGRSYGVHQVVKTDKETVSVQLSPAWYLENQDIKISPGDKVEITGSRVSLEDKPATNAAEVKKGDEMLKLRDESGYPVWSGWRRR
jgi:hypothetical protein